MKEIQQLRQDFELPLCIENWGWKYHHLGIPTNIKMPNERYLPHLKFYVSGFSTCPFGIEWMRFDDDCPISDLGVRAAMIKYNGAPIELIEFEKKSK